MRDQNLEHYYARRAREYDRIYERPERAEDLARMRDMVRDLVAGRDVLEIGCGTGYWTAVMRETARFVLATDAVGEVLDLARARVRPSGNVGFALADAFDLAPVQGEFDTGFAGFWWSHVPRARVAPFLDGWHARLGAGARAIFMDNLYVPGSSTPIAGTDEGGDTYQDRSLDDGSTTRVLKNFPGEGEFGAGLAGRTADLAEIRLKYYWIAYYTVGGGGES